MRRLVTLDEFLPFLPKLTQKHAELDGKWSPELTPEEFASELISHFVPSSYYFGDFDEDGSIGYFMNVVKESPKFMTFWLLFVNTSRRSESKQLVSSVLDQLRQDGVSQVQFRTTRLTSSYQRWVEKFNAQKYSLTYKIDL